ncbi:MAG: hypothetical protein RSD04_05705, partial [Clostridia bacterium]
VENWKYSANALKVLSENERITFTDQSSKVFRYPLKHYIVLSECCYVLVDIFCYAARSENYFAITLVKRSRVCYNKNVE